MRPNHTDVTIVLDRSGSMADVATDTIGGFNTFLDTQKQGIGTTQITLRQFDDQHEWVYTAPLEDAPKLTPHTFKPRGGTALLDAIGMAIDETGRRLAALHESDRPSTVVVCIITDGYENSSRKYSRQQVFDMIEHQRTNYRWQFTFIGANQDAIAQAASINIPSHVALNYQNHNTVSAFAAASASINRGKAGMAMSYTSEERKAALAPPDQPSTSPDQPTYTSSPDSDSQ